MPKKAKKLTALGQVREASGKSLVEFAKMLGLPTRTLQAYCLGQNPLPPLPRLEGLEYLYGVDLRSLQSDTARQISGLPITEELCREWENCAGLEAEEVELGSEQLAPMVKATLQCLQKKDPIKARLLLFKLNSVIEDALKDKALGIDVETYFDQPDLGDFQTLEKYVKGEDLEAVTTELPSDDPKWELMLKKIDPRAPVKIVLKTRPVFGLPHRGVSFFAVRKGKKNVQKPEGPTLNGFETCWAREKVFTITQGKKRSWIFTVTEFHRRIAGF